ncbi:PilN domain-containing protein [candidate division KSB1 bacterium]|nr:PilN domain-containing protein [candidate division KSB1 bacterium]
MKIKNAIGISINGNNVKAAFLSIIKGKVYIQGLQSTTLRAPLESSLPTESDKGEQNIENDLEKAFDIQQQPDDDVDTSSDLAIKPTKDSNVSVIYSLLDKFKDMTTKVGINAPVLTVKYEMVDADAVPKDNKGFRERIGFGEGNSNALHSSKYHRINSEKSLRIEYEHHPPVLDLIDEVNQFRRGNLKLEMMDTNELALAFLVAKCYKLNEEYTTAIIYIEPDFSRVIFLSGKKIHHITPIIHKGSISKDVLHAVYSKIIFAQDHHFVPELDKIILASRSAKLKGKTFFKQKFPSAKISYFNSKLIDSQYSFDNKGRLFSQYAIPIAFAWKLLQKKSVFSKLPNLLPDYILERRRMPKLAFHGYILLFLLAITAFTFTYLVVTKNVQISKINRKNKIIEMQIENNKPLVEKVKFYGDQIFKLESNIALVDSISMNYDETYTFLKLLNQGILKAGDVWIEDLKIDGRTVELKGYAKQREIIPILSEALGGANLKKVTRATLHEKRVFNFQLDKNIGINQDTQNLQLLIGLTKAKQKKPKSTNGTVGTNGPSKKGGKSSRPGREKNNY